MLTGKRIVLNNELIEGDFSSTPIRSLPVCGYVKRHYLGRIVQGKLMIPLRKLPNMPCRKSCSLLLDWTFS